MGHIYLNLEVANCDDIGSVKNNFMKPEEVRRLHLKNVLIDTGASTLCLPAEMIAALGLSDFYEEKVAIATGTAVLRTYNGVQLTVDGRTTLAEVMELPTGSEPLLGAISMQSLGIRLDLEHETYTMLKSGYRRA